MQILVAGAGAAGLMAAAAAARAGAQVTVLEQMKKPGRKLLLTGSGRCNLTNLSPGLPLAYEKTNKAPSPPHRQFAGQVIRQFGAEDTLSFFEEIGVSCSAQSDLVYPRSFQAETVLKALLEELGRLRVKLKYDTKAVAVSRLKSAGKWKVNTPAWSFEADRLILACGGRAAPETGSDGSGYGLARMAGHTVTATFPALTAILTDDPDLKKAAGARTHAEVKLLLHETVLSSETGEIQWTAGGLSGIAVFQLSRIIAEHLKMNAPHLSPGPFSSSGAGKLLSPFSLRVDLVPDRTEEEITGSLQRMVLHSGGTMTRRDLLGSFTHGRVADFVDARLRRDPFDAACGEIPLIARTLKNLRFGITGLRDFSQAQVTCGGVSLGEVNPDLLESLIAPGLHFAGEILDIDGPCGGYNLQWAWSSGYVAGSAAAARR